MAATIASRQMARADNIFFPSMALLILAVVVYGFAQSYFLPGMVLAKTIAVYLALPLLVVAYDLLLARRVHRSTAIAVPIIIAAALTLPPVANLSIWQPVVTWIRHG